MLSAVNIPYPHWLNPADNTWQLTATVPTTRALILDPSAAEVANAEQISAIGAAAGLAIALGG